MSNPMKQVVVCADRIRGELLQGMTRHVILILSLSAVTFPLSAYLGLPELGGALVVVTMACIVVPKLIRQHRSFASLICASCGQSAGEYFTQSSRIHLRCKHCGEESPTDCGIGTNGGIPYKIP